MEQVNVRIPRLLLSALFCLFAAFAFGQNKELEKANELYQSARYAEAAGLYEKVLESYSEKKRSTRASLNVMTKLARCYGMNNRYAEAEKLYAEIVQDERARPDVYLYYAETLMVNEKYEEAKKWLLKYQTFKPEDETAALLIRSCEAAPGIQPFFKDIGVKPFPYNSEADDNAPIAWNGGILFSSDRKSGVKLLKEKSGWTGRDFLDLYFSEALPEGGYAPPVQFSGKLSVLNKNLCNASITSDGSVIYFTRNDNEPNRREIYNLQLYSAKEAGGKWKDVEKLPFCSSGSNYMHPAISPDGKTLFFTSDKPGGQGGTDLWMSRKNGDDWERPVNLGETVNTSLNEGFPFVSADGRLFFCSKGHPGLGGFDIFMTRQNPDGTWQEPVNLGRPINSSYDDISIFLNPDGHSGLFTSAREGGDDDIYFFSPEIEMVEMVVQANEPADEVTKEEVHLPVQEVLELPSENERVSDELKPEEVIAEEAPVEQMAEQKPEDLLKESKPEETAEVTEIEKPAPVEKPDEPPTPVPSKTEEVAKNTDTRQEQTITKVSPDHKVKEPVTENPPPAKALFDDVAEENKESKASDTLAASEMMTAPEKEAAPAFGLLAFEQLERRLNLNTLKVGDRFRLDGARYDVNVWQPTPQVARALDLLAEVMKENPTFVIELGAHTESIGLDSYNLELSKNRAELAREYLLREGITPDRIIAKGYGETELLNHCANGVDCSLMEHLINQRLEVKILKL